MKVEITTKVLLHDRLGRLVRGQVAELPDGQAESFLRQGWVQRYDTKVIESVPSVVVGATEPSSALPAAPVSPQTTLNESDSGDSPEEAPVLTTRQKRRSRQGR